MGLKERKNIKKSTLRSIMIATIFCCCVASFYVQRQVKELLTRDIETNSSDMDDTLAKSKVETRRRTAPTATLSPTIEASPSVSKIQGTGVQNDTFDDDFVEDTQNEMWNIPTTIVNDLESHPSTIPHDSQPAASTVTLSWNSSFVVPPGRQILPSLGLPTEFPRWMKTYFNWHRKRRMSLNESNWKSYKYLILRCTHEDRKCGGLADRLKPLPYFILLAARHKRIFLIRWNTPAKLEEFLVPNKLDWSVPEWMEERLMNDEVSRIFKLSAKKLDGLKKKDIEKRVIEGRIQDLHGGAEYYEKIVTDPDETYDKVYHKLFKALFNPSPPIQKLIEAKMEEDHLRPGKYAVAHYRAFYGIEDKKQKRTNRKLRKLAINAVNCATSFRPGGPVYFASDSKVAVTAVSRYARKNKHAISVLDGYEALHIDKFGPANPRPAPDFYSVFVDLLLMANGNCVTFGQGGFGQFALLLSNNATCSGRHVYKGIPEDCKWEVA